jgi:ABC-2 type transport system permease protein
MKLARDTWLTFTYETGQLVQSPSVVAAELVSPIAYLLFFTPFIKAVLHVSTYGGAFLIYLPSLFVATGLFGGLFSGLVLIQALREGVIARFRVTPLSRVGLLLGRELKYVVLVGFQAVVMAVIAFGLGLRLPLPNFLLALVLLSMAVLIGVSISYVLAILVPNETVLSNLTNGVGQPLALLAGVYIPVTLAPLWVRDVALWNPYAWAANGMRTVFMGHIGAQVVWEAAAILGGLTFVTALLSSRVFTREIA